MDPFALHIDEDQDSLFGSPPPSTTRGRSPQQETFIQGTPVAPTIAVPSTGLSRKNVGTIALPGSHMSCAELPAHLPASSLSFSCPASSRDSQGSVAATPTSVGTPIVASQSSSHSNSSRASSTPSTISPTSALNRKRRSSKAKSQTPAPPAPPITLPGPNDPTPPNFLRSQSSLLGLAGLVGCVRPSQLYTHGPQPMSTRQHSPIRGSTPTHPIMLDDDQDTQHIEEQSCDQPQPLDQVNPDVLRSNILNSLAKEKNIFPVLESLLKLLGSEPHLPSVDPSLQPFARPYGHGIFNAQPPSSASPPSAGGSSTTSTVLPSKRRKLKHVPAGAVDWDIPFPFAAGEGPKGYRNSWAQDRAKQLVTQLLELVQNATKRAAIKTAKDRKNTPEGRSRAESRQLSRSASVENQIRQTSSTQADIYEPVLCASPSSGGTAVGTPNNVTPLHGLDHLSASVELPSAPSLSAHSSEDKVLADSECMVEESSPAVSFDYSGFEEWLAQLQQFIPVESGVPTPESGQGTRSSVPFDPSGAGQTSDAHASGPHIIQDEAIDPALLAMSLLDGSSCQSQPPASSTLTPSDIPRVPDGASTPSMLTHSPRTSLSSLTEPLTPLSDTFASVPSTMPHQGLDHDPPNNQPVEKERESVSRVHLLEPSEPLCTPRTRKGKAKTNTKATSATSSTSSRYTPGVASTSKGVLDKQAIVERARERRRQLVEELDRAKMEIRETSIENATLVRLLRDGPS